MAADNKVYIASTTAPVNIAVVKYWGKRDLKLNLPTNSSLSVTLSQDDLRTHTTASCSSGFDEPDSLLLNSSPQDIQTPRTQACLQALRSWRRELEASDPSLSPLSKYPLRIVSENNFPTAAGLASSAAGFAALVRAVANLYDLPQTATELSRIARQGSGSACRSLFGGYVAWRMGAQADGSDSMADEIAPAAHWPEMRALILVVSAEKKAVGSTVGMQATVATSSLFKMRAEQVVPARMREMEEAIRARNFPTFARLTMQESNNFHATCLDTHPPIFYLNDVSRAAIKVVEAINAAAAGPAGEGPIAAYTFDAGPNAVIYYLASNEDRVVGAFKGILNKVTSWKTPTPTTTANDAKSDGDEKNSEPSSQAALDGLNRVDVLTLNDGVSSVIQTSVGDGPRRTDHHLVDGSGSPVAS